MRLHIGPRPKCDYATCNNPAKYHRPQLCGGHYAQLYAGQPLKPLYDDAPRPCSLCAVPHYANGFCRNHYDQDRRKQKRIADGRQKGLCCTSAGCAESIYAKNMCLSHYRKELRRVQGPCKIAGCPSGAQTARRCHRHYKEYLAERRIKLILTQKAA